MANYYTLLVVQPEIAAHLLDEDTRARLEICSLTCAYEERDDTYYLYNDENVGYDEDDVPFEDILQEVVEQSAGALPYLTVEAALTCSKPRPDGFGGYAMVITADGIKSMSTSLWLAQNK